MRDYKINTILVHSSLIALTALMLRGPTLALSVIDWDESIYALVAREILNGNWPYSTVFDHKPIGIYLHLALAMSIFGDNPLATRVLSLIVVIISALILYITLSRIFQCRPLISFFIATGYVIASTGLGGAATNSEHLINMYVLLIILFAFILPFKNPSLFIFIGLFIALAIHTNYISISIVLFFIIGWYTVSVFAHSSRKFNLARLNNRAMFALSGFIVGSFFLLLPVMIFSDLREYFVMQHTFLTAYGINMGVFQYIKEFLAVGKNFYPIYALIIFFVLYNMTTIFSEKPGISRDDRDSRLFLAQDYKYVLIIFGFTFAGTVIAISSSGHFFPHYFLLLLPSLCLMLGLVLSYNNTKTDLVSMSLFIFTASSMVIGSDGVLETERGIVTLAQMNAGRPTTRDVPRLIASNVRPLLKQGETSYVACAEPVIYQLIDVRPPTRFPFWEHHLSKKFAEMFNSKPKDIVAKILENPKVGVVVIGDNPLCPDAKKIFGSANADWEDVLRSFGFSFYKKVHGHEIYLNRAHGITKESGNCQINDCNISLSHA